jgi:hypothetical protein
MKVKSVIPDLVSEERAESVGNPCLDTEVIRAGSITILSQIVSDEAAHPEP